jgi:hypothetical protein
MSAATRIFIGDPPCNCDPGDYTTAPDSLQRSTGQETGNVIRWRGDGYMTYGLANILSRHEKELLQLVYVFVVAVGAVLEVFFGQGQHGSGRVAAGQQIGQIVHQYEAIVTRQVIGPRFGRLQQDSPKMLHLGMRPFLSRTYERLE